MSKEEFDEYKLEERKFLHDVSTPTMVVRLTLENLQMSQELSEGDRKKLERAIRAINSISDAVDQRRSQIKSTSSGKS